MLPNWALELSKHKKWTRSPVAVPGKTLLGLLLSTRETAKMKRILRLTPGVEVREGFLKTLRWELRLSK